MKEALLQYAWQHKLFYTNNLQSTNGESIEVIDVGQLNSNAGPDFFNAKIKIGDTLWAGNVEVHVRSSDWVRHHHEQNSNYQSVILHVIHQDDGSIKREDGEEIPQLILPYFSGLEERYEQLLQNDSSIACSHVFNKVEPIIFHGWLNALMIERLEQKAKQMEQIIHFTQNNWEESFYILLTRNFGLNLNGEPFEQLAKSLSNNLLSKHKNNLFQIEALLFGQSGLLDEIFETNDEYVQQLQNEALFLRKKYSLTPMNGHVWKMLRLRPINFPTVRIAQLAALIHQSSKLFSKIVSNQDIAYLMSLFQCEPSLYWKTHYSFYHSSESTRKVLGDKTIQLIIINTLVPFLFLYGRHKDMPSLQDSALELLEKLPAEQNHVIKEWGQLNIAAHSSFESQALIHLKKHYCDTKKCLHCRIGHIALSTDQQSFNPI
jgi:hypothetical protein